MPNLQWILDKMMDPAELVTQKVEMKDEGHTKEIFGVTEAAV